MEKFNSRKSFGPLVHIKLPWIGRISQVFHDNISKAVTRCFSSTKVRTIFTTRLAFLSSQKDDMPSLEQSMLISKFQCLCEADYCYIIKE